MHAKPLDGTPWNRIRRRKRLPACLDRSNLPDAAAGACRSDVVERGSARVEPVCMALPCLPDAATYAAMLGAETQGPDVASDAFVPGERKWSRRHDDAALSLLGGDASRRQAHA